MAYQNQELCRGTELPVRTKNYSEFELDPGYEEVVVVVGGETEVSGRFLHLPEHLVAGGDQCCLHVLPLDQSQCHLCSQLSSLQGPGGAGQEGAGQEGGAGEMKN